MIGFGYFSNMLQFFAYFAGLFSIYFAFFINLIIYFFINFHNIK